ncbi:hypothetical protein SporoP37_00225 [Sporosarcina sp. P37]|uniref:hypothetical protein n=1 Tax=unclassified Sporosarcina TaxID=2647733 RepID=UPI000A17AC53|nr:MULTISPECIES: hypothetical protein [unclassified Sporosarcina]ARK23267.1 hypothetical protein SporoP37_00225 [Sporosarcina sp. P37]PID19517.1 hypothetical protein CSV62_03175 [Sporosarcina sp. P35]
MNQQTIQNLVSLLKGIKHSEWSRIKQQVDMMFSHEAAKVELGDTSQLQHNLEVEFRIRRFGDTSD